MRQCSQCGSRFSNDARFCPHDGEPTVEAKPARADSLIGELVAGRYRVDSILGEGGMGIVYRAVHVDLDKVVAIKVLRSDMALDEIVSKRFVQEAKALSRIPHAHIVDVFDFGKTERGAAYFVMEYLEGRSLREAIRRNDLSAPEILRIARAMAEGLAAAHAAGIIHRDLKPENIQLITRDGDPCFVKILDFGVAKVAGVSKLTRNGAVFGTPHYMSPEQAQGLTVDHRSDIYSYGIILYELFTGKLPFDADTFVRVISQQIFDPPPPLEIEPARAELGAFAPIVLGCLEKKITDRYRSFEAVIDAIDSLERESERWWRAPRALYPAAAALVLAIGLLAFLIARISGSAPSAPQLGGSLIGEDAIAARVIDELSAQAEAGEAFQDDVALEPSDAVPNFVLIDSDPQGAFVSLDGIGLGVTPIQIPRPMSGDRRLRIERDGRMAQEFMLGSSGPERLVIHLPDRRAQPVRMPTASPARSGAAAPASAMSSGSASTTNDTATNPAAKNDAKSPASPPSTMQATRRGIESEVVDPWSQ